MVQNCKFNAAIAGIMASFLLSGCQRAPSVNLVGSFFPVWLLCITVGIFLAIGFRYLLIRLGMDEECKPAVLVYPCLAVACTLTLWLVFFS